jgi:hypothetical protein
VKILFRGAPFIPPCEAGRGDHPKLAKRAKDGGRGVFSMPPPPCFAWSPSPALCAGADAILSRSRGAYFFASEVCCTARKKPPNKKGGGAPKGARVDSALAPTSVAACTERSSRRALPFEERARLPALYRGSRQSFRLGSVRSRASWQRQRAFDPSATRAASSWQTGVVAGRASFRTARGRSYEPHPGHRPRSINRPSPVDVPHDERDGAFLVRHAARIQTIPPRGAIALIRRGFSFVLCWVDSRQNCALSMSRAIVQVRHGAC